MAKLLYGERIAATGTLGLACSACLFDGNGQKILLTRRSDNGRWCLPGGWMEAGESVAEACAREVWEETGLRVAARHLVGVYSSPDRLMTYADGNRYHLVALHFVVEALGGELGLSDETTEAGYFDAAEIAALDLMEHHRERIADSWSFQGAAFIH